MWPAAGLGGVEEFIKGLPDVLAAYLDQAARDHQSGLPSGRKTVFGREASHSTVHASGGVRPAGAGRCC